jgi:hypothetical protein
MFIHIVVNRNLFEKGVSLSDEEDKRKKSIKHTHHQLHIFGSNTITFAFTRQ